MNVGYNTLTRNLHVIIELDAMPILQCKSLSRLDKGPGIAMTPREHDTKYHKSCKDKVNACKLDRARERKRKHQEDPPSIEHTRAEFSAIPQKDSETCFFNCGKPLLYDSCDSRAHTFKLYGKVKQWSVSLHPESSLFRCEMKLRMHEEHGKSIYRGYWGVSCIRHKAINVWGCGQQNGFHSIQTVREVSIPDDPRWYHPCWRVKVLQRICSWRSLSSQQNDKKFNTPPKPYNFQGHSSLKSKSKQKMSDL